MATSELFAHERRFLSTLASAGYHPETIYDIGASTGIWSEIICSVVPSARYELFEPLANHPAYCVDLESRLRRWKQLRLHRIGLAEQNFEQLIHVAQDVYGSSLLDRGAIPEVQDRVPIKVMRLDDFVEQNALPVPNVIKIDCQGAERKIIDGGSRTVAQADVLFLETWLKRGYGPETPLLNEVIEQLQRMSFTIVDIGEKFFDDRHRLYSVDAFFCSERLLGKLALPVG